MSHPRTRVTTRDAVAMSSSELSDDEEPQTWIEWFCQLRGHEFFCDVDTHYIGTCHHTHAAPRRCRLPRAFPLGSCTAYAFGPASPLMRFPASTVPCRALGVVPLWRLQRTRSTCMDCGTKSRVTSSASSCSWATPTQVR